MTQPQARLALVPWEFCRVAPLADLIALGLEYDAWLLDGMPEGVWLPLEVIVDTARGEVGEVLGGLGRGLAGGVIRGRGGRARRGKPGPKPHGTR